MRNRNRVYIPIAAVTVALLLAAAPALAAKEKFVRNKPHVNIGTIGHVDHASSVVTVSISLLLPAVQKDAGPPESECSGRFDVRVLDGSEPGAQPLAEWRDARLAADRTIQFDFDGPPGSANPLLFEYVSVVARKLRNVGDGGCLLRGVVEVRDRETGAALRTHPLRPEDFVPIRGGRLLPALPGRGE